MKKKAGQTLVESQLVGEKLQSTVTMHNHNAFANSPISETQEVQNLQETQSSPVIQDELNSSDTGLRNVKKTTSYVDVIQKLHFCSPTFTYVKSQIHDNGEYSKVSTEKKVFS